MNGERDMTRYEAIARALRDRIIQGSPKPGAKLPTWDELAKEFEVGRPTLTRALDRLKADGFIYADSRKGTFVAPSPPHLSRFGLVLPTYHHHFSRFWEALILEAARLSRDSETEFVIYRDTEQHVDNESRNRLFADAGHRVLGGAILVATDPLMVMATELRTLLPVTLLGGFGSRNVPALTIDRASFADRAVARLVALGCRRIAAVSPQYDRLDLRSKVAAAGLDAPEYRFLTASFEFPETVQPILACLMNLSDDKRPDGLIVTDDNLVDDALTALGKSGARIGSDLHVVVHCNWPQSTSPALPVERLGFDSSDLLRRALDLLRTVIAGGVTLPETSVKASFEHELPARSAQASTTGFPFMAWPPEASRAGATPAAAI